MSGTSYPSSRLVATAWTQALGLNVDGVGRDLPADPASWAAHGFVQVSTAGGVPHPDLPVSRPVVQFDVWGNRPGAAAPPWALVGDIAGQIVAACYDSDLYGEAVALPAAYRVARVLTVIPVTVPREVAGDPAGFARVTFDAVLTWTFT